MAHCMTHQEGKQISLEYTVYLEDGTRLDSNIGETPLVFVVGRQQLFPALEKEVVQLVPGDQKEITLQAEEAYGPILKDAFREIDLALIPPEFRRVGAVLGLKDPEGGIYPVKVDTLTEDKIILNFNHPLAGKNLRFSIKVLDVA